jgi:CRP-like cAMP-binding protein/rhodanese-related sulfurtransferase
MLDLALFRRFVPTHSLNPTDRAELARCSLVHTYQAGEVMFVAGTPSRRVAYLIAGTVRLEREGSVERVVGGTEAARYALTNGPHYAWTAHCETAAEVLYIERDRLDQVLTWNQAGIIEVRDINEENSADWMAAMLRSPVLQQVPSSSIVRVIASVEPVDFAAGEAIIRYDAPGDYYYVLVSGECRVLRPAPDGSGSQVEVDRIPPGEGFGEEALVSGLNRNATVEAVTDCKLVRLPGRDFQRFLREPMVQPVPVDEAEAPSVQTIDVRLPEEYAWGHLPGALNMPLRDIRVRCSELDASRPIITYCDGGGRSASATFLLRERGFNARWVEGGAPHSRMTAR